MRPFRNKSFKIAFTGLPFVNLTEWNVHESAYKSTERFMKPLSKQDRLFRGKSHNVDSEYGTPQKRIYLLQISPASIVQTR